VDFTDMVQLALLERDCAPGNPQAGFFDEVQDFSRLELKLAQQWASHMEVAIFAGDDDQCIYTFRGSDPEEFFKLKDTTHRTLSQSYRLPHEVLNTALAYLCGMVSPSYRQNKLFKPRAPGGVVRVERDMNLGKHGTSATVDLAVEYASKGKEVMILASCGYMLRGIITALRSRGIPFHNPHRPSNRVWNPLAVSGKCMKAFLEPQTSWPQVWCWLDALSSKKTGLTLGSKKLVRELITDGARYNEDTLTAMFSNKDARARIQLGDPLFLVENAKRTHEDGLQYALRVLKTSPITARDDPLITVGTIHSVKGGETDVVLLAPDISPRVRSLITQCDGPVLADLYRQQARVFYVGMTRAREVLHLLSPLGDRRRYPAVSWCPGDTYL
jgi:superfamily I DNA/RNA helicase